MQMESQILKTNFVALWIEQGVVVVDFLSNKITVEEAQQIIQLRLQLIGDKSYPVLVDGRKVGSLDKESRNSFAGSEALKGVKAGAILIDSTFNKFLGNFFLKVTYKKEKLPTMIFTDRQLAINWLKKFN